MGNLVSIPNTPMYANHGTSQLHNKWELSGGSRPYVVLVFNDKKMILINIHAPHYTETFDPTYLKRMVPFPLKSN